MQGNAKTTEGAQHPDRDAQFRYISEQARAHQEAGDPVISVDTKKKELVGEFANGGKQYRPKGRPVAVRTHDFMDKDLGKAIPYGVYDVAANAGWVSVGTDHDTAAFAVESIRRWWKSMSQGAYPAARRLLVTADAGGSNGYRTRAWKAELAAFALETGLAVTVCHFPPGTSKWNKIEHRLLSAITLNWRGRPLGGRRRGPASCGGGPGLPSPEWCRRSSAAAGRRGWPGIRRPCRPAPSRLLPPGQQRLQHSPLRVTQVRAATDRYGRHEVSGAMVFLVVDSSTGDLSTFRAATRHVTSS